MLGLQASVVLRERVSVRNLHAILKLRGGLRDGGLPDTRCGAVHRCQNAAWRGHKKTCRTPLPLGEVFKKLQIARPLNDTQTILQCEDRFEELMTAGPDPVRCSVLSIFAMAYSGTGAKAAGMYETLGDLCGKMLKVRDQGQAICDAGTALLSARDRAGASKCFQRAHKLGQEHGLFQVYPEP